MKKKILLPILLLLLFIVGCSNKNSNEIENNNGKLLVALVNYNFKIGATYDGVAIFDDGTVYTRYLSTTKSDYNSVMGSYSINTQGGLEKLYLEKGIKKEEKIPKADLANIYKQINALNNDEVDINCDNGNIYSTLYIVKKDELLKINVSDCEKNASNKSVKDLIALINKVKNK